MKNNQNSTNDDFPTREEIENKLRKLAGSLDQKYKILGKTMAKTINMAGSTKKAFKEFSSTARPIVEKARLDMETRILLKQKIELDNKIRRKQMEAIDIPKQKET